jgi:LacI family transcriptional regulator
MNLEDIARKAGVSRSTVSRVINNDRYVSEETRKHVQTVIDRERFQPNHAARALVKRRTEIIGVLIPHSVNIFFTDNSYFPMLLQGIGEAAHERDHAMLLWLGQTGEDSEHLIRKISSSRMMDGLIIASLTSDHPLFEQLPDLKFPVVMVERPLGYENHISYVTIDNVRGAETAVRHLISLGRRRIAHITGQLTIADGQERLKGYKNALQKAGLPIDPNLIVEGRFTHEDGYIAMKQLLRHKPDAVFAPGDTAAVGAMQAIREAGLRVPEDIAIIGFDDLDVATRISPQLTTIRQPVQQKGAYAARLLIDLIEQKFDAPQHVILPTELVIRQSCGAAIS